MPQRFVTLSRRSLITLALSSASMTVLTRASHAQSVPYPRVKPPIPNISTILQDNDAKLFKKAMAAVDRRFWRDVRKYKSQISHPTAKDTLNWLEAWRDANADFDTLTYAAQNLSDWPRMTSIRAKAEKILWKKKLSPQSAINWFRGADPVSGEGRAVLARAYYDQGQDDLGKRWLQSSWREARLTRDFQRELYRKYKSKLTPEDHAARADYLIWLGSSHFSKRRSGKSAR